MAIVFHKESRCFHLYNNEVSYIIRIMENEQLEQLYYGKRIHDREDFTYLHEECMRSQMSVCVPEPGILSMQYTKQEFPTYGTGDYRSPALTIAQENGSRIVNFTYAFHEIYNGNKNILPLPATYVESGDEAQTLEITLHDAVMDTDLILSYTIYEEYPVITRNAKVSHNGSEKIVLDKIMSASVEFNDMDYEMVQLSGGWSRERYVKNRKLEMGIQSIQSLNGTCCGAEHNPFLALKRPHTTENQGEVYGFSLVYSGNHLGQVEVSTFDMTRVMMGINPEDFSWELTQGESFQTPEVVMVYSDQGLNKMSQTYHRIYRKRLMHGTWRDQVRPILLNNWEATYFDFNEEKILNIAKKAKEAGVELFVLDDGWFGARDDDYRGLGDWYVNTDKLEGGLKPIADGINAMGMKFGLWFEPECISEDSDLYRAHPDWAIQIPGRQPNRSRYQLILDMGREDVRDYLFERMTAILDSANIEYVKWDMNRHISDVYSAVLPKERQGEASHRYMLGLYDLLERLVSRYPNLLLEGCSGGGGRFDLGMLYYSPQIWCSDDTDAVERLSVQYGTSFCYPISTVGSHVSAVPNHQTGRITPVETRGTVAMAGSFGYELDLNLLSDGEKEEVKEQIKTFKKYYNLTHEGEYYRLTNPMENRLYAAWEFVSQDQSEALVHGMQILAQPSGPSIHIPVRGLKADAMYEVNGELVRSGRALMHGGLNFPRQTGDFKAVEFYLKEVK
mgnify:CR=1 FL=1